MSPFGFSHQLHSICIFCAFFVCVSLFLFSVSVNLLLSQCVLLVWPADLWLPLFSNFSIWVLEVYTLAYGLHVTLTWEWGKSECVCQIAAKGEFVGEKDVLCIDRKRWKKGSFASFSGMSKHRPVFAASIDVCVWVGWAWSVGFNHLLYCLLLQTCQNL